MTLAAYLVRWGCCLSGSGRLCIKPKSAILETYNLMEFALLGCDFWGMYHPFLLSYSPFWNGKACLTVVFGST